MEQRGEGGLWDVPIAVERLEVVTTRQFLRCLSLSSCVSKALTT
jgi:hypothetical protein